MTRPITIETQIHFERRGRGSRKNVREGNAPEPETREPGRVPRVARLMALAIRFEELIKAGEVASYGELARLSLVTRARITQIMNLNMLAPDIQESLLYLPRIDHGRDPIRLGQLQSIALVPDWRKQRRMWRSLMAQKKLIDR